MRALHPVWFTPATTRVNPGPGILVEHHCEISLRLEDGSTIGVRAICNWQKSLQ